MNIPDFTFRRSGRAGEAKRSRPDGFTLIELLAVVAIVATLVAVLIPATQTVLERSYLANGLNNARQLATATQLYAADHNGDINGMGPFKNAGGDITNQWQDRIEPYLGIDPTDLINRGHPKEIQDLPEHMGWAINNDFTPRNRAGANLLRKFSAIAKPGEVVFATDGYRQFREVSGQIPGFTFPKDFQGIPPIEERIFFPYNGKTIALFLDWHTEILAPPIDPDLLARPIQ